MGYCSCGAKWYPVAWAHCGSCHATFTAVDLFDAHRSVGECWLGWRHEVMPGWPEDAPGYVTKTSKGKMELHYLSEDDVYSTIEGLEQRKHNKQKMEYARSLRGAKHGEGEREKVECDS